MQYFLLFMVPLITSANRILQKKFKQSTMKIEQASNVYIIIVSITAMLFFGFMAKGKLMPNMPTILFSVVMAIFSAASNILTLLALDKTDVATIAVFSGAGIIFIPFLYGALLLNEQISIFKIITLFLLIAVIILPLFEKRASGKKRSYIGYIYCIIIFLVSGGTTVLLKLYALNENVLDTNVFCFWTNVIMFPIMLTVALYSNPKQFIPDAKKIKPLSYAIAITTVVLSNLSAILQVFVLKDIDITLFTLLNSPTALLLTAILSWLAFSEKINKQMALSIILSIAAIIFSVI